MSDLISRQELMTRLTEFCEWCKDGRLQGAEFVLDCLLPNTPSVEAVEGEECDHCVYKWGMKGGDDE